MPEGPLAFLPLNENYSSIVWSTTPQLAKQLLSMKESGFNQRLQETFGDKLGEINVCSERAIFPLRLRHAQHYVKPAMALIGDAAHTVHPLAGQGVNLGFLDAQLLANELIDAINKDKNPGDYSVLRKYERGRKASNVTMLASMDLLKRLFSNNHPILSFLRNTGLNLVGSSAMSRKFFINYALGKHN
jgi:2-polyprenylphenol 6-hydroxylase